VNVILVSGAIANKCLNGGEAWVRLSWALGLKQLGFRVFFVEQIAKQNCVNEKGDVCSFQDCSNLAYFKRLTKDFNLADSAALIYGDGEQVYGVEWDDLLDIAASADLLINISGHLAIPELRNRPKHRAYIDIDPGFTQFWHANGILGSGLEGHSCYYTL
jgi:hypothetical protein